jgi:hypothetical protein
LTTLGSTTLESVGGSFTLGNLTKLSNLPFSVLTEVKEINWVTLPVLDVIGFTGNITTAEKVLIGNTFLSSLAGINLNEVDELEISNNNRLTSFVSNLGNVTKSLIIGTNGRNLQVSFPRLTWAFSMTFRNISAVSLPSLTTVNGTLGFYGNFLEGISAPKLVSVGQFNTGAGGLAFVANSRLTQIDMPVLKTVGGAAQIANNTALETIDFPALESVGGAVDYSGTFGTPKLPKLKDVRGGFNLQSTEIVDCTAFASLRASSGIQGVFKCAGAVTNPTSTDGTTTNADGTTASPAASGSGNPASSYGVNQAVAGVSIVGGLFAMLL